MTDVFWSTVATGLLAILLYAVLGLLLMLFGYYAIDLTTPGKLTALVRAGRPNAVVVSAAGLISMALIVVVAIYTSASKLTEGLLSALIFGVAGIVVQAVAVRVLEAVARIDMAALLRGERFTAVSVFVGAVHLALGLVVAFAIS